MRNLFRLNTKVVLYMIRKVASSSIGVSSIVAIQNAVHNFNVRNADKNQEILRKCVKVRSAYVQGKRGHR